MLPASHRLRRRRDFQVATRRGRRAGGATLVLHLLDDPSSGTDPARPPARVGFVVGRGCGPAVRRNRVRRRLRHLMRPALPALPAGALLVVRARPAAAGASTAGLHADLARLLDRVLAAPGRSRS